jgi:predicted nucleic acid-binding protein
VAAVIAYIDSSVVLRIAFQEADPLEEWKTIDTPLSSELLAIEVRRSLDRLWLRSALTEEDFARKSAEADTILAAIALTEIDRAVIERAAQAFPTPLGTLDAFHLATAIRLRETRPEKEPLLFATHDLQLAQAARAMNFEVIGAPA